MAFNLVQLAALTVPNVEARQIAISGDGNTMAICYNSGAAPYLRIWKYNGTTARVMTIDSLPAGVSYAGVAVSPDGSSVYVSENQNIRRWVYDSVNDKYVPGTTFVTTGGGAAGLGMAISPDGNLMAISMVTQLRICKRNPATDTWSYVYGLSLIHI